jgi:hypothetical protein
VPTPLQWLVRLEQLLDEQRRHAAYFDRYYSGERTLDIVEADYGDVFGVDRFEQPLLGAPYSNVAAIGVDALAERLQVDGFRVGGDDNTAGADAADELWTGNDLDAMSTLGHTESFVKGTAGLLAWPGEDGRAVISIEDAEQLVVHRRITPPYDVDAALKLLIDEWTGDEVALLWLENVGRITFRKGSATRRVVIAGSAGPLETLATQWVEPDAADEQLVEAMPERLDGRVPVVELANRQRLLRRPSSELVHVAPLADVHDKLIADMVIAASFGAIPIRTATGVKLMRRTLPNGDVELLSPFDVRADRAMVSENPDARFGSIPAADLAGYVAAIDMVLREIRALTRVPQHYYGEGVSAGMSGETLKAAESSLVRKAEGIQPRFGASWRKSIASASRSKIRNSPTRRSSPAGATPRRRSRRRPSTPRRSSPAIGVPLEIVLERLGYPRSLIARAKQLRNAEQLRGQQLVDLLRQDTTGAGAGAAGGAPAAAA